MIMGHGINGGSLFGNLAEHLDSYFLKSNIDLDRLKTVPEDGANKATLIIAYTLLKLSHVLKITAPERSRVLGWQLQQMIVGIVARSPSKRSL